MADELTRAKRKLLAIRRAERRLQNRLADIDFELDVLQPEILELEKIIAAGEIPTFEIEDANDND